MDKYDHQIISLLKDNSRYSNVELAEMLDISEKKVDEKIKHLVSSGIIRQFSLVLNENLIEGYPIKALVELSIRPEKDTGYDSIAKRIFEYSEVVSHYLVSGNYDFLVIVQGKNHRDIAHFVFDKLATIANVKSTTTHFIFKSYKEQGVLLDEGDSNSRVAIMP